MKTLTKKELATIVIILRVAWYFIVTVGQAIKRMDSPLQSAKDVSVQIKIDLQQLEKD